MNINDFCNSVFQPRGGFLSTRWFDTFEFNDDDFLYDKENIPSFVVILCVGYLTRVYFSDSLSAFDDCIRGMLVYSRYRISNEKKREEFIRFTKNISSINADNFLSDDSIALAVYYSFFGDIYKRGISSHKCFKEPDVYTIHNIRVMVKRTLSFFENYGRPISSGFNFDGNYKSVVSDVKGDFVTMDSIVNVIPLKKTISSKHTLALFIYWRLGIMSDNRDLWNVKYLSIFNPRLNILYEINISDIPDDVISNFDNVLKIKRM